MDLNANETAAVFTISLNAVIVIFDKYEGNGNFYFEWDRSNGLNSSNFQLGTGAVSEEIYNQYDIGDTYCIEELML